MLSTALVVGLAAGVLWAAPVGAAVSDGDCQALLGGGGDSSELNRGSTSDLADLAQQAQNYAGIARDVSDKKLKRALLSLSDVYSEASKAKNTTAASLVLTKRAKKYGKALNVYGKAVTQCLLREVPTTSARGSSITDGSSASSKRCPLSAEQVSSALGVTVVKDEGACTYFPANAASPNAVFVRQVPSACQGSGPADLGYTESFNGLGVKAYVQRDTMLGTTILACSASPFEIVVDIVGNSSAELTAVEQLAKQALGS